MKLLEINKEYVVSERDERYWGTVYDDVKSCAMGWVSIDKAYLGDPIYCTKPTDMTWTPSNTRGNSDYEQLEKATLRRIVKTTIYELQ